MAKASGERRMTPNLLEIDGIVRVEKGPPLKTAKATEDLLSDEKTASHYYAPRALKGRDGKPLKNSKSGEQVFDYAKDATGKNIELGKQMTYLDWLGSHVFYVYQLYEEPSEDENGDPIIDPETGDQRIVERWREVSVHETEDAALSAARKLASATK